MSEREFVLRIDDIVKRYQRRIQRLRDIGSGRAMAKVVPVKGHYVRRHWVGDHVRVL